jgi:hypothetical protein
MPVALFIVTMSVLGLAADTRELYLMPVLLPLALLAAYGTETVPSDATTILD